MIVTPTASVAVCPKRSVNVTVHDPELCAVTVNCAGALTCDAGVTFTVVPHVPALAVIGPE